MSRISKADIIEAVLFASDRPVSLKKLAQIMELESREAEEEIEILREEKARIGGLQLIEAAGGWQLVTKPEFSPYIKKLREVPRQRLSRAAFEVLAIVAYRQPVTRGEIESLRGVDCAGPVNFLLDKKLVALGGRKEAPGRPWLYETTPQFLDHFGLRAINDLPSLAEFTELNAAGADLAAQNLFRRPRMQGPVEGTAAVVEGTAAVVEGTAAVVEGTAAVVEGTPAANGTSVDAPSDESLEPGTLAET